MSHQPSRSTEQMDPPRAQAEEAIAWGKVIGVGVGSIVTFALAIYVSYRFQYAREKALQPAGPDPVPAQIGQGEIGLVDQVPFDVSRSLQTYRRDRLQRLESWGWIDRKRGTVHMPIERAMDLVVQEQKK
jgi:hypothetical protein